MATKKNKVGRPSERPIKKAALMKAIKIAGGVTNLSLDIQVSQSAVSKWLHTDTKIPSHHVPKIVRATKGQVKPEELRPDVYIMGD